MSRRNIAILGGGVGALSAALELTELDSDGDLFDITVYQEGWRLGGKGAAGRNLEIGCRGEEHGLHVWTGFYDNAFNLVDRCYDALERLGMRVPFGSRSEAFDELDFCTLMEQVDGGWRPCRFDLPRRDGVPGVFDSAPFVTLSDYVCSLVDFGVGQLESSPLRTFVAVQFEAFRRARRLADSLPRDPRFVDPEDRAELRNQLRSALMVLGDEPPRGAATTNGIGMDFVLVEIALTLAYGVLADDVFADGFDVLDDREWSAWMHGNGCSTYSLNSAVVRACYDYVFAFVRGSTDVAAGTGTRILLKLVLGYKGSFFYVMKATMGELLFAPLYTLLRKRNVKFEFFHRVERLGLDAEGRNIDSIDVTIQATPAAADGYNPLVTIDDGAGGRLDSWPSHPKYELLKEGDDLKRCDLESAWTNWRNVDRKTLKRGEHFHDVVLGIGLGALGTICTSLVDRQDRWKDMATTVRTTQTMALQLWTTRTTEELGWRGGRPTIMSAFAKPLDSWGDLSLLLGQECWKQERPAGLHYFVGVFRDAACIPPIGPDHPGFPAQELAEGKALALAWIKNDLHHLWPNIVDAHGHVKWELLFDPAGRSGEARLDAQYLRVNINPSERYVQSVKGSLNTRMRADESGFDNLFLAGDWVRTGINAGCVEAAVMAGRAAAGAIRGVPIDMPNSNDFSDSSLASVVLPGLAALRKLSRRAAAGVGSIDAHCVILSRPRDEVQARLAPGLRLREPPAHATHDVVLVFARQRDVRPGIVPFGGLDYAEVFEIIPDVEVPDHGFQRDTLFSYMPNLLLDNPVPVMVGQGVYGFSKQLARIRSSRNSVDVRSAAGATAAQFERTGLPGDISQFREIHDLQRKLELPLIGVSPDGSFMFSILDYQLEGGTFQRITGAIRTGAPFFPRPENFTVGLDPAKGPWGFHMACAWSLSLPADDIGRRKGSRAGRNLRTLAAGYGEAMFGKLPLRR